MTGLMPRASALLGQTEKEPEPVCPDVSAAAKHSRPQAALVASEPVRRLG